MKNVFPLLLASFKSLFSVKKSNCLLIALVFIGNTLFSQIIYVNANATGNNNGTSWVDAYTDLAQALNNTYVYNEVWIAKGMYGLNYPRNNSFVVNTPNTSLYGGFNGTETTRSQRNWKENPTILSGGFNQSYTVIKITGDNSTLDGLIIQDGRADGDINYYERSKGAGVIIDGYSCKVINCIIRNNTANALWGIYGRGSGGGIWINKPFAIIRNTIFINNKTNYNGGAVLCTSNSLEMINCTFVKNDAPSDSVLYSTYPNNRLTNSIVTNNLGGNMFDYSLLVFNSIINGSIGTVVSGQNNLFNVTPLFVNENIDDYRLLSTSPAVDHGANSANNLLKDLAYNPRITDGDNNGNAIIDAGCYELNSITRLYVDKDATGTNNGENWTNAYIKLEDALFYANNEPNIIEIWVAKGTYKPANETTPFLIERNYTVYGGFNGTETSISQRNYDANPTVLSGDLNNSNTANAGDAETIVHFDNINNAEINGFTIENGYADNSTTLLGRTGAGIYNDGNNKIKNCIIKNNNAFGNGTNDGVGGGIISFSGNLEVINTLLHNNNASANGGAISSEGGNMNIYNATIMDNTASKGGGIHFYNGSVDVKNCILGNNTGTNSNINNDGGAGSGSASYCLFDTTFSVNVSNDGNNITNTNPNLTVDFKPTILSKAINTGNNAINTEPIDLANNSRIINNQIDLGAYESTLPDLNNYTRLYVNKNTTGNNAGESWNNALNSFQTALDVADLFSNIKEIWVAKGTYYPTAYPRNCSGCSSNKDYSFHLVDGVSYYGGFNGTETSLNERDFNANPTILSGNQQNKHVILSVNDNNILMDGFQVKDGYAFEYVSSSNVNNSNSVEGSNIDFFSGAGVHINNSTIVFKNMVVRNNRIISLGNLPDNYVYGFGAGFFFKNSQIIMDNVTINNNEILGLPIENYYDTVSAYYKGVAIASLNTNLVVSNSSIFQNQCSFFNKFNLYLNTSVSMTSGLYIYLGSISLTNCLFTDNNVYTDLNNNIITNAISILNNSFNKFTNVTIFNNSSGNTGISDALIYLTAYNSSPTLEINNSVIYNNSVIKTFNIISGNLTGNAAYTQQDPAQFGSPAGFTHLLSNPFLDSSNAKGTDGVYGTQDDGLFPALGSVLIGTGNNSLNNLDQDLTGNARIYGSTIDIGAYESKTCLNSSEFINNSWTNGLPNDTDTKAIISSDYSTNLGNITACDCEVNPNSTLHILENTFVQTNNNLINNGSIIVEPKGNFVQTQNKAKITGSGNFSTKIKTTPLLDQSRFTYMSSPAENTNLSVFSSWSNANQMYSFNSDSQNWQQESTGTVMKKGIGYAIAPSNANSFPFNAETNFQNKFNTGTISQPTTFNAGGTDDDNTLIGNPYPSAIDGNKLLTENSHLGTLYFWTHQSQYNGSNYVLDDYAMWNLSGGTVAQSGGNTPTGNIASGQGFFTTTTGQGSGKVVFNNGMRTTNNADFYRNSNTDINNKIWINMQNGDGIFNQILLSFLPNATIGFDPKFDGEKFNANAAINFYSIGNNQEKYGIQALPLLQEDTIIPLGYNILDTTISHLKITIDHINRLNGFTVYLKDNVANVIHNLLQSEYEFNVIPSDEEINNRFEILFTRNSLNLSNAAVATNSLVVYNTEDDITIKTSNNSTIISKIIIYNVLGKKVFEINKNQTTEITINNKLTNGNVYIVKAFLENGVVLSKKIIKF